MADYIKIYFKIYKKKIIWKMFSFFGNIGMTSFGTLIFWKILEKNIIRHKNNGQTFYTN